MDEKVQSLIESAVTRAMEIGSRAFALGDITTEPRDREEMRTMFVNILNEARAVEQSDGIAEVVNDPATYRQMLVPHPNAEEAESKANRFYREVAAARRRAGIAEVVMVSEINYLAKDGEESSLYTVMGLGASTNHERLAAYALGRLQSQRQESIGGLVSAGKISAPRTKRRS